MNIFLIILLCILAIPVIIVLGTVVALWLTAAGNALSIWWSYQNWKE